MPERRLEQGVPSDLPVVMGVDVDKARRDQQTSGVDLLAATARHTPDLGYEPVVQGNVGRLTLAPAPVYYRSAAYYRVVHVYASRVAQGRLP